MFRAGFEKNLSLMLVRVVHETLDAFIRNQDQVKVFRNSRPFIQPFAVKLQLSSVLNTSFFGTECQF